MNISIIGAGYVGLVSGTCLAEGGHTVTSVDVRSEIVSKINRGRASIYEKGLEELLAKAVSNRKLKATTDTCEAVLETEVTLICVGTPTGASGTDLAEIISAAENVGRALAGKPEYHVVVIKSTVIPGTTEGIVKETIEAASGRKLGDHWGLCMNPEFLREGRAVEDFLCPDRVVIGASDDRAAKVLASVYAHQNCPKVVTSPRTAEMIKYVANSLFATLISFSNEMANLCSRVPGVDARDVWRGVHLDRRLVTLGGESPRPAGITEYLWHGLGFGGSCFPKDVRALRHFGKQVGAETPILDAVLETNGAQPLKLVGLLEQEMDLREKRIAVLGVAFKPGTDDVRESPALPVIAALCNKNATVIVHDPVARLSMRHLACEGVHFVEDWESAIRDADACCLITSWPEYKAITPHDFKTLMRYPLLVDGRGLYDAAECRAAGVFWRGIGCAPAERRGVGYAEV